ncbi:hypothetical protein KS242_08700 [Terribacillus sp. DMT04]|nr:DUF6141 family protein [Terribacillus sp. DMT04]QXE03394.1 hypothetical protein KS242_08700 [Terribacillus sp. DMT04]
MKTRNVLYKEVQRPQLIIWIIFLSIAALMWYAFIHQVLLGNPFGSKPASNATVIVFWLIFGLAFPLILLKWTKLIVEVHEDGLYIRFMPFHLEYKKFLYKEIKSYKSIKFSPFTRFGGWGFRVNFKGETGYISSGKQGIELTLKYQTVVISAKNPDELIKAMDIKNAL